MPKSKSPPPVPIRWRNLVTEHPEVTAIEWAVAMAISMHMDNKTGKCYPGTSRLQAITRLSRMSVKRGIKGLNSKGS